MSLDKNKLRELVIEKLEEDLEVLIRSANEAKDFATDEEAKAENKYDTKGLEASYLAGAQAKRAKELAAKIDRLKKASLESGSQKVAAYTLLEVEVSDHSVEYYFILPEIGGIEIDVAGAKIMSLSLESPLTKKFLGREVEDEVSFKSKTFLILNIA